MRGAFRGKPHARNADKFDREVAGRSGRDFREAEKPGLYVRKRKSIRNFKGLRERKVAERDAFFLKMQAVLRKGRPLRLYKIYS